MSTQSERNVVWKSQVIRSSMAWSFFIVAGALLGTGIYNRAFLVAPGAIVLAIGIFALVVVYVSGRRRFQELGGQSRPGSDR